MRHCHRKNFDWQISYPYRALQSYIREVGSWTSLLLPDVQITVLKKLPINLFNKHPFLTRMSLYPINMHLTVVFWEQYLDAGQTMVWFEELRLPLFCAQIRWASETCFRLLRQREEGG